MIRRFNELNLHDCRLTAVALEPAGNDDRDVLRLSLDLVAGEQADQWRPAQLTFRGCAAARVHIDTFSKRACSDAISDSSCELAAETRDDVLLEHSSFRQQYQPIDSLVAFTIDLCPPSGSLVVVARDFDLEYLPTRV